MNGLKVERKRRPRVEINVRTPHDVDEEVTKMYTDLDVRVGYPARPLIAYQRDDGIRMSLTRAGIELSAFYDGGVGIEGGFLSWEEFDALRAELK